MVFILIIFVLFIIGGAVALFIIKKRTNKSIQEMKEDGKLIEEDSTLDTGSTVHELPFKNITDSMIDLGKDQYRMVVECSSINLELKTSEEQEIVEISFQRFLQTLNFAFSFYIQTREIDNRVIIENTAKDAEKVIKKYPFLLNYANMYLNGLESLSDSTGNSKFKKKYLIITYNDINKMSDIEDEDKLDMAFNELQTRCMTAIQGLKAIGIDAHILNSNEIAEMVFRAYNKEGRALIEGMTSGEMTSLVVDGKRHLNTVSTAAMLDVIILEFFKQLETSILAKKDAEPGLKMGAEQTIAVVNRLRDRVGGYYKEYPSSIDEDIEEFIDTTEIAKTTNIKSTEPVKQTELLEDDDEVFSL